MDALQPLRHGNRGPLRRAALFPGGGTEQASLVNGQPTASSPVVRLPFVSETIQVGGLRIQPFEKSIAGITELGGTLAQLQTFANALDPNTILVLSGNKRDEPALLAAPLQYVFGRDALVVAADAPDGEQIAKQVDTWRAQGRDVIFGFGTNGGRFSVPRYTLEPLGNFGIDVPQWTFAYDVMPRVRMATECELRLVFCAVPRENPETYPFVLNFGGDDFPYLVRGFLERSPEAQSRWIGGLLSENPKLQQQEWISAVVRVPVPTDSTSDLKLTLRARAPRENVRLDILNNATYLGSIMLSPTLQEYTLNIPAAKIETTPDGFLLEFAAQTTLDGDGHAPWGRNWNRLTLEPSE